MSLKVTFLGVEALGGSQHSCILVERGDTRILLSPTQEVENIDAVIITDIHKDDYSKWKYYAKNNIPIYSIEAIKKWAVDQELGKVIKSIGHNFKVKDVSMNVIKVPVEPHSPAIGISFPSYRVDIVPELPPFIPQAAIEAFGLPPSHLIVGIGSYTKLNHKISFEEFIKQLERARTGKEKGILSLTLTNFRKDLKAHKDDVLRRLKEKWDVPIKWATKDMVLEFDGASMEEKNDTDVEKAKYSREKCMDCSEKPEFDILWAEGIGRAWFCKKHAVNFLTNHYKDCIAKGYPTNCDIDMVRKVDDGIVTEHWKDNKNADIYPELLKQIKLNISKDEESPEKALAYSKEECMACTNKPEYEILWGEGTKRVWFCKIHTMNFLADHYKNCSIGYPSRCDIDGVKQVDNGIVVENWKDNLNPDIYPDLLNETKLEISKKISERRNFTLAHHWWGKAEHWDISFAVTKEKFFKIGITKNPLEMKDNEISKVLKKAYHTDWRWFRFEGDIPPGDKAPEWLRAGNPTTNLTAYVKILDTGKYTKSGTSIIFEGRKLKGLFKLYNSQYGLLFRKSKEEKTLEKLQLEEFKQEGVVEDIANPKTRWKELLGDLRYLGNSGYPRVKKGEQWGKWELDDIVKYFAACVDALRSVWFTLIPPDKSSEKYSSSFWELYRLSEKFQKIKPPTKEEEAEWNKKRKETIRVKEASDKMGYYSKAKPAYRIDMEMLEEDLKHLEWINKKILSSPKIDGLRVTVGKSGKNGFVYVDPEELKQKSPNVSNRMPLLIKEIEQNFPEDTITDAEFFAMRENNALHRTVANSILNSKAPAEKFAPFSFIYIFDVLFYKGEDVRNQPLEERIKILNKIKTSKHIIIENPSTSTEPGHDAYICTGISALKKAWNNITTNKAIKHEGKYVLQIAEGIMLKTLDHQYEFPQNKGWAKVKRFHEVDTVVLGEHLVKGTTKTWNYFLGIDISKDYAAHMLEDKAGIKEVRCIFGGKVYEKEDCREYLKKNARFLFFYGKSDNTNVECGLEDILRVASEEVIRYENEIHPKYPFYHGYINRAMEKIPEKHVSDTLTVLLRLSLFEPKRIPIEELARLKEEIITKKIHEFIEYGEKLSLEELKKINDRFN